MAYDTLPHEEIPVNSSINLWIILVYFLAPSFILAWPVLYMWVLFLFVNHTSHKQSVFNLVQSLKTLFLHTQSEKETVEEYARNFRSLWDMVEAFGGSPGIQQGLVQAELKRKGLTNPTDDQIEAAEDVSVEQVKAALLISGADRRKFGRLKDELANNYLLGTDQYPDTLEKAGRILSNYQSTNVNAPFFRGNPNDTGVAFLQRGGRGGRGG